VFSLDARVLGYALALAMLTGLVFGVAPALNATHPSLTAGLKGESATIGLGARRHRLRDVFVIGQVAVSLTLVVAAALVLRSFGKALDVDPGFDARNGVAISFDLTMSGFNAERQGLFLRQLVDRVGALSGVQSASVGGMPLSRELSSGHLAAEGSPRALGNRDRVDWTGTWPGYFRTMGIPLVAGRDFLPSDDASSAPVAIVNEQLARRLWPGEFAIGKRVRLGDADAPMRVVVGVSRGAKVYALTESGYDFAYLPARQDPQAVAGGVSLVVRSSIAPATLVPALVRAIREVEPNPPFYRVRTFAEVVARGAEDLRGVSRLLAAFGALALLLAALGLYGVISHAVSTRTREIGVRVALGARAATVVAGFVREGASLALVGVAVGVPLSVATGIVMRSTLFGVGPLDPLALAVGALALGATAVLASYLPARRAARVDPIVVLRSE
jgi:putative ABC transport system permease protein